VLKPCIRGKGNEGGGGKCMGMTLFKQLDSFRSRNFVLRSLSTTNEVERTLDLNRKVILILLEPCNIRAIHILTVCRPAFGPLSTSLDSLVECCSKTTNMSARNSDFSDSCNRFRTEWSERHCMNLRSKQFVISNGFRC
jgi:hypothetical protein